MNYSSKILLLFFILLNVYGSAQDLQLSTGSIFEGEPYLATNPADPEHMIVAWMGHVPFNALSIKSITTFDHGATWSDETVIPHEFSGLGTTSADPSIEFDNFGNVFLCYVDYNVQSDSGAVFVRRSTNGGLSWESPVEVINIRSDSLSRPADRPWMRIDRSSGMNNGNIYVTTMSPQVFGYIPPPYHPYFTRSTDGGVSFEPWQYLDTEDWLAGSLIPQPAPFPTNTQSGVFHCVYPSFVLSQSTNAQYIMASTNDGGVNFTHSLITGQPFGTLVTDTDAKRGYPLVADLSNSDHLVFLSLLNVNGDADVFFWETYDAGATWSTPVRINDDPIGNDRMQDLIWADFDNDGDLLITWCDRRNGSDSTYATASEIWGAVRSNGAAVFQPNFLLSDTIAAYDPVLASGGNDFMCVDLVNDTINAVWGDTRNGFLSIWFKKLSLDGTVVSVQELSSEKIPQVIVYPNPTSSRVVIEGEDLKSVVVYDSQGNRIIARQVDRRDGNVELNLEGHPNGTYVIDVSTSSGVVTKKVIKQ